MQFDTWLIFSVASIGLSLSPGPNSLLVLTHGALHGSRKTLFTILGGTLGFIAIIALCMFGIGALIKSSILWLTVLRWVGGAYLVWLGIQVWRSPPIDVAASTGPTEANNGSLFRQGFLAAATNPKGLLFFSAFLTQFIDPHRSLVTQFAVVAATFAVTESLVEYTLASAANRVRPWLGRVGRRFNRACGGVFVAIGAVLPLQA
ncbi:Threonine/homoserine/homoserine lactone efflux protein [Stigmatella aurantiaca]|uniref:Threonine/homoserine/homoserine lactone efflux protein n=1 Tax=Stigmatella aurantiaca TaxID=41 RepID=A0A1H8FJM2_STIAU|nr:LysE family transporter [Stigmatella aurantiaca]SEN31919.1 Threonine/homoserine/homoserine lactone efflux protein [Stigmatella aurantiaca]